MKSFAKIFETPTTQVLFYLEYDPGEDHTIMHGIGMISGAMFDIKGIYPGEDQEQKARQNFDALTIDSANRLVDSVTQMMRE